MKIAFIVQRYGAEILGGSEYHCRLIAEHLSRRPGHGIEVLTTCAREYTTWENAYPEGTDRVRGVTVRRFPNAKTRDLDSFNEYSDWIFSNEHSRADEWNWLEQQGPWCPALIDYLGQHHRSYDALIFFTYLYAPTVLGLKVAPRRSILVPTAHDEPAIKLSIYQEVFSLPAGIAFNTASERGFLKQQFAIGAQMQEVVGCGVDLPPHLGPPLDSAPSAQSSENVDVNADIDVDVDADADDAATSDGQGAGNGFALDSVSSFTTERGAVFRRRHRLYGPFVLYGGRIDAGKGCEELIEYFSSYADEQGDATLALMGVKLMSIPEEPFIRFAGLLPEIERLEALEAATVVVVPSPYESLSLLALEAFAVGTPILANARSDVLTNHCQQSNAGLYYGNREEFVECLKVLMNDGALRTGMGHKGRAYVQKHYSWDVILEKYERMMAKVAGRREGRGPRRGSRSRGPRSSGSRKKVQRRG